MDICIYDCSYVSFSNWNSSNSKLQGISSGDKTGEVVARTINVNGDGVVNVAPDIAYVSLGVTTEKSSVDEAQKNNATTMNNIIATIKKSGVASEDIKTSNYAISPKYNHEIKQEIAQLLGTQLQAL